MSVSLSLCLLPGSKGTARQRRTQALKPCLTSSGRAPCLSFVLSWFPKQFISHFVCSNHGGGSLAQDSQNHAEQVVESELVFQLRPSHRRWIANPCLGARFRATAVIREQPPPASTTGSADWYTHAVSLFTGPATWWIATVPACWERSHSNPNGNSNLTLTSSSTLN